MTVNAPILTSTMLEQAGAFCEQVERFESLYPQGAEVTVGLCVQHASDFDFDWAADYLLAAAAMAEYKKATAAAMAEYKKATAAAWAEYRKAGAIAWAEAFIGQWAQWNEAPA